MLWLIGSILCSASLALIFKRSERDRMNRSAITAVNYATAVLVCIITWLTSNGTLDGIDLAAGWSELREHLAAHDGASSFSASGSVMWALAVGGIAGFIFPTALIVYQVAVKRNGASLAGAFLKLGTLVPMSLSLIIWREQPSIVQWTGITLALGAIVIVNWPGRRNLRQSIRIALLGLFLLGGLAEFSNKVFEHYADETFASLFLLTVFGIALLVCIPWWIASKQPTRWRDIGIGIAVGVPNMYTSYCLIQSLKTLPASVAYPVMAAGTILVINAGSYLLFRERLTTKEWLAMGMILVALVLINTQAGS
jgi:drug/metabolite transporter (DMT)-like permease